MKTLNLFLALIFPILLHVPASIAQTRDELKALRKDIETLKKDQSAIQKELQEIKNLLTKGRQLAPSPMQNVDVVLFTAGEPFKGDKNAKVSLIEFSDYQCPFCARHFAQTWPQVEKEYIQTGKIKYVMRDFPIESIHPQAFKGHEAASCAGEQGKYWEMHGWLFTNQKTMGLKELASHGEVLGLNRSRYQECLSSGKYAAKIRRSLDEGQKAGVQGTPTFFLGLTEGNGAQVKAVRIIRGAQPYAIFKQAIDGLLGEQR